jgi:uncharacterized membrane protein YhaH (DUF805 family)
MLLSVAVFSIAVAFQVRIPGEVLLILICVPRLHDLGRSGWWIVLPIVGELAAVLAISLMSHPTAELDNDAIKGLATLAGLVVLFLPTIALLFIPGQQGPNRFGEAPEPGISLANTVRSS